MADGIVSSSSHNFFLLLFKQALTNINIIFKLLYLN